MFENESALGEFVATSDPIEMAAEIVAAFVSNNAISVGELPSLIEGKHASLKRCVGAEIAPVAADPRAPAVSIRKSVTPD